MSLRRVTCTITADALRAADALAKRLGRSRSWVVSEALRRYGAGEAETVSQPRVSEPARSPYRAEFDAARAALREADLRLTPAERLRSAEDLTEDALRIRPRPRIRQVLVFDSLEDYFAWKKRDALW